jgi:8-oxo-dGTP diphosphatase
VVWRRSPGGPEVLVVHRPAPRDDWSLPKGKLDPGERHRDAALREVLEETGWRCRLGPKLVEVRYPTPLGEDKRVRWWVMEPLEHLGFTPGREVDEVRWVAVDRVGDLLTWDLDRSVVQLLSTTALLARP